LHEQSGRPCMDSGPVFNGYGFFNHVFLNDSRWMS
jgi:hypothetical protein